MRGLAWMCIGRRTALTWRGGHGESGAPAPEAKAVGENADGAEGHGGGGNPGAEQDVESGVEQTCGKGDSEQVVDRGPGKILPHDAQGGASQSEGGGNGGRRGAKQQNIAGFLGKVG